MSKKIADLKFNMALAPLRLNMNQDFVIAADIEPYVDALEQRANALGKELENAINANISLQMDLDNANVRIKELEEQLGK